MTQSLSDMPYFLIKTGKERK